MSSEVIRSIDAVKASVDVLNLNNTVVSLRVPLKKTKIRVITKLVHQIRVYKKKRGTEEQIVSNQKKCDRLLKEIEEIKKLENDTVLKFALGNSKTLADVSSQNDLKLKAMVRLATHKMISKEVQKWRSKHSDWQSLAAFLMQHTSRRLKRKKKKVNEESDKNADSDEGNHSGSCSDSIDEHSSDEGVESEKTVSKDSINSGTANTKKSSNKVKDAKKGQKKTASMALCKDSVSNKNKTTGTKYSQQNTKLTAEEDESDSVRSNRLEEIKGKKCDKERSVQEYICSGEVVVKRINLEEMGDESQSPTQAEPEDIQFLFRGKQEAGLKMKLSDSADLSGRDAKTTLTKRKRDDFFLGGDSEDETSSSDNEAPTKLTTLEEDETEESVMSFAQKKMMVESTFLGCLSNAGSKSKINVQKMNSSIRNNPSSSKAFAQSRQPHSKQFPHSKDNVNFKQPHMKSHSRGQGNKSMNESRSSKGVTTDNSSNAEKKLHPSWEASMRRKQEQSAQTKFEGKRITFND